MVDLRVVHIIEATLGGTGRHVLDIIESCAARGMPGLYLVHSLRRADTTYRARLAHLPKTVRVNEISMEREILPLVDLQSTLALVTYLRSRGVIDVVHTHSSKAGAIGSLAARISGVRRIIFTPNGFASAGAKGRRRRIYLNLERVCSLLAHYVVAVSPEEYNYALRQRIVPHRRLYMIPNGICPPDLSNYETDRRQLRAAWGIRPDTRLIGSIGRLTAQKAPLLFVELAARRARRYTADEEMYLMAGDGELASEVRTKIRNYGIESRVIMAGFRTDVNAVLASLDIFVLHSYYEGMPYTVLEAMGHRLPIVSTRVAGVTDPLRDGGLIVEIGDVAGLDEALDQLICPERRRELGEANRRRLERHFALEHMIQSLLQLYCKP